MSEPKLHYFDDSNEESHQDIQLGMAKIQGYVPTECLLGGAVVMAEVMGQRDPCAGCAGPRERCGGRPKTMDSSQTVKGRTGIGHFTEAPQDEAEVDPLAGPDPLGKTNEWVGFDDPGGFLKDD